MSTTTTTTTTTFPFSPFPPHISIPSPPTTTSFPTFPISSTGLRISAIALPPLSASAYHASQRWLAASAYWAVRSGRSTNGDDMIDVAERGDYFEGWFEEEQISEEDGREGECCDDEGVVGEYEPEWRKDMCASTCESVSACPLLFGEDEEDGWTDDEEFSPRAPAWEDGSARGEAEGMGMRVFESPVPSLATLLAMGKEMCGERVDSPMQSADSTQAGPLFACKTARRRFDAGLADVPHPPARFLARCGAPSPPSSLLAHRSSFSCKDARREFDAGLANVAPPPARFLARGGLTGQKVGASSPHTVSSRFKTAQRAFDRALGGVPGPWVRFVDTPVWCKAVQVPACCRV